MVWPFDKKPDQPASAHREVRTDDPEFRAFLSEILAIEVSSFTVPWTARTFQQFLRRKGQIFMERSNGHIIAYLCATPSKRGWILYNMAVGRPYWRRGVGTALVNRLRHKLYVNQRVTAYVSEYNTPSQLFLRAIGFRAVAIQSERFLNQTDGYVFVWKKEAEIYCGKNESCAGAKG